MKLARSGASWREDKALFFDFGGTLALLSPSRESIFSETAREFGLDVPERDAAMAYHMTEAFRKFSSVKIKTAGERKKFYLEFNGLACEALGISSFYPKMRGRLLEKFGVEKHWRLAEGAAGLLKMVKGKGYKIALVANWDAGLENLTKRLGVREYFDVIIASGPAGVEKPDPRIFRAAIKKIGLTGGMGQTMHVGDDYRLDVIGARAAGLRPVLIDRLKVYDHADCARFASLSGFSAWMRRGGAGSARNDGIF